MSAVEYINNTFFKTKSGKLITCVFFTLALLFVALAILGGINNYSPLLVLDAWDLFPRSISISNGDWTELWKQHNEHRLVINNILFWIDMELFHGNLLPLIVLNYIIPALGCIFLILFCYEAGIQRSLMPFFIICLFFSWEMRWLFTKSVQDFSYARTIPLIALYFLYKSSKHAKPYYFAIAVFFGIANVGTMSNGIFLLPLMTIYAWLAKLNRSRILLLGVLSVFMIMAYLYQYNPNVHINILDHLKQEPGAIIKYFLAYIGALFKFGSQSWIAILGGCLFIFLFCIFCAQILLQKRQDYWQMALLMYCCYMILTAGITSMGRTQFGLGQAVSSRYMGLIIAGWCALLLIVCRNINLFLSSHPKCIYAYIITLLIVILAFFPKQLTALHTRSEVVYRELGALSISLGANDNDCIRQYLFPDPQKVYDVTDTLKRHGLTACITSKYNFLADMVEQGTPVLLDGAKQGRGSLDKVSPITGNEAWTSVSGWIYDKGMKLTPQPVYFLDETGKILGCGLTGLSCRDAVKAAGLKARYSGFYGYLKRETQGRILIYLPRTGCHILADMSDALAL